MVGQEVSEIMISDLPYHVLYEQYGSRKREWLGQFSSANTARLFVSNRTLNGWKGNFITLKEVDNRALEPEVSR